MAEPLDGFVMEPAPVVGEEIATVICGHDFIQELPEYEQIYFHQFVREVLKSYGVPVRIEADVGSAPVAGGEA